jgi:hypothetical protein
LKKLKKWIPLFLAPVMAIAAMVNWTVFAVQAGGLPQTGGTPAPYLETMADVSGPVQPGGEDAPSPDGQTAAQPASSENIPGTGDTAGGTGTAPLPAALPARHPSGETPPAPDPKEGPGVKVIPAAENGPKAAAGPEPSRAASPTPKAAAKGLGDPLESLPPEAGPISPASPDRSAAPAAGKPAPASVSVAPPLTGLPE